MKKSVMRTLAVISIMLLICACGSSSSSSDSDGSGDGDTWPDLGTQFASSASIGDVLVYSIDTSTLEYEYEIVESDFGLEGETGSGTLVDNNDGTYSPADDPFTRII